MIRSLAGLPEGLPGTSGTPASVISQVYNTSSQKLDLLIATFADSYWRSWHQQLLQLISVIVPDVLLSQIAPQIPVEMVRSAMSQKCGIDISHTSSSGREDGTRILDILAAALQVNDRMGALVSGGLVQGPVPIVNLPALVAEVMGKFGCGGSSKFFTYIQPPPPPPPPPEMPGPPTGLEQKGQKLKTKLVIKSKGIDEAGVPTEVVATRETVGDEITQGQPPPPPPPLMSPGGGANEMAQ